MQGQKGQSEIKKTHREHEEMNAGEREGTRVHENLEQNKGKQRSIHTKGGRETIGRGVAHWEGAGNHKGRKADMVGQGQVKSVTAKVQAIIQFPPPQTKEPFCARFFGHGILLQTVRTLWPQLPL